MAGRHFRGELPWAFGCILTLLLAVSGFSGEGIPQGEPHVVITTLETGIPSVRIEWGQDQLRGVRDLLRAMGVSPIPFTSLAVGWLSTNPRIRPGEFKVAIRTRANGRDWTPWLFTCGELGPDDSPSGLFWSPLYLPCDFGRHSEYEVEIRLPAGMELTLLRLELADASEGLEVVGPVHVISPEETTLVDPFLSFLAPLSYPQPTIITREQWWGNLPPGELTSPRWPPQVVTVTHVVVHHTATANNPPNPPQVVRDIWNYHANTLGWGDIGYNFLVDQYGNIYQGRYNPWLSTNDVRAAHAYYANYASFGVALIGQFHPGESSPPPGYPSASAVSSLEKLIAWRFSQYGLDPLSKATINTEWGYKNIYRICGHRDVGSTACPGDYLYEQLPSIRQNVANLITATIPVVVTFDAWDVTSTTAYLFGGIVSDGGSPILDRCFCWSTQPDASCNDNSACSVTVDGNVFYYQVTDLTPDTRYYFRAWARNSIGWGYGEIRSFTTSAVAHAVSTPSTPIGPSSGEVGQSLTFSTGGASCSQGHAVEYRFDWGDGTYSSWSSSTSASKSWGNPGTYSVRAQARCAVDNSVVSSWSSALTVTISSNNPPNTPTLVSPENGATGLSLTPTLQASSFSDPDGDSFAASHWQVDNNSDFSSPEWDSGEYTPTTSVTVPISKLSYSTTYWWRVRYKDSRGAWSSWSSSRCFTTQPMPPSPTGAVFRVERTTGNVLSDGAFYGAGFYSGSADIAEWVPVSEPVEPGDVLELDPTRPGFYRKARGPCSTLVAGVVSTQPGVVLGQSEDRQGKALLALIGIVPVKVTDEGGPIRPGDLLVTSSTPGYAMRWDPENGAPCAFVGKALEPHKGGSGVILVLLTR